MVVRQPAPLDNQCRKLLKLRLRRLVAREFKLAFQGGDNWIERTVDVKRRALVAQGPCRLCRYTRRERTNDAAFANPRFTGNEDRDTGAVLLDPLPALQQHIEFVRASDERCKAFLCRRVETAFRRTDANDTINARRLRNTLERM